MTSNLIHADASIETFSGDLINFYNLQPSDIRLEDIAHSLSMICRFNGHTSRFYSVAEHSVHICRYLEYIGCSELIQTSGLLHDSPEYLLGDITRPLKRILGGIYKPIERRVYRVIAYKYNIPDIVPKEVIEADNRIIFNEKATLLNPDTEWGWKETPLPRCKILGLPPDKARELFMLECGRLGLV